MRVSPRIFENHRDMSSHSTLIGLSSLLLSSSKITAFSSFDLCYFFFSFFLLPLTPFLFFIFISRLIFEDLTRDKKRSNQRHRHRQTREREKETVCMHVETRKRERETDRQAERKIEKETQRDIYIYRERQKERLCQVDSDAKHVHFAFLFFLFVFNRLVRQKFIQTSSTFSRSLLS